MTHADSPFSISAALATGLLALSALAQSAPHTDAMPRLCTGAFGNLAHPLPFARSGGRIQYWFRWDNLRANQLITALGVRAAKGVSAPASTASRVEVKLSSTTVPWSALSSTFASNHGPTVTTVFVGKPVSLPALVPPPDPNRPMVWLPSDNPFVRPGLAPNIVCEFDLGSAVGATDRSHYADAISMTGPASSMNLVSGAACGSAKLRGASPSSTRLVLDVTGAPPSQPVALLIGTEHTLLYGSVPLPYRLDALGMPGCVLGVETAVTLNLVSDPLGALSVSFPIALGEAETLYAQAVHPDATKPLGFATTNVVHSILGGREICDCLFNWSVDGPVAQYGPFFSNLSTVILVK